MLLSTVSEAIKRVQREPSYFVHRQLHGFGHYMAVWTAIVDVDDVVEIYPCWYGT